MSFILSNVERSYSVFNHNLTYQSTIIGFNAIVVKKFTIFLHFLDVLHCARIKNQIILTLAVLASAAWRLPGPCRCAVSSWRGRPPGRGCSCALYPGPVARLCVFAHCRPVQPRRGLARPALWEGAAGTYLLTQ